MSTPPSSAESIEAVARRLAQWIKYSWDGLGSGSIVDRGYPEWAGHAYQGGQDDLRRLAAELVALSAPAQCAWQPIETAPRDGQFLVYMPHEHRKFQVMYVNANSRVAVIGGGFAFDMTKPTLWMPLPEVSALSSTERQEGS